MARTSIFNNLLPGNEDELNKVEIQDLIESQDQAEKDTKAVIELQVELKSLEEHIEVYNKLEEQEETNTKLLEESPDSITDNDIQVSQESLFKALKFLKYSNKDILSLRISSEAFNGNKLQSLYVSNESVQDAMKKVLNSILELFKSIKNKLTETIQRTKASITSKTKVLQNMRVYAERNGNLSLPQLNEKQLTSIYTNFIAILAVTDYTIDIKDYIQFYSNLDKNPFLDRVKDFVDYVSKPENTENKREQLIKEIYKEGSSNKIQKSFLEWFEKNNELKRKPIFLVSARGQKVTFYVENDHGQDDRDKHLLGFYLDKYDVALPNATIPMKLNGVSKIGDFLPHIVELTKLTSSSGAYMDRLMVINNIAVNTIKQIDKQIEANNFEDQKHKVLLKNCIRIIKDIGMSTTFELMAQYTHNTNSLVKLIHAYLVNSNTDENSPYKM